MTILNKILNKIRNKNSNKYLREITGVIHVGANTGQERYLYNKYNLKVLWIEPIPEVYEKLKKNIQKFKDQTAIKALITDKNDKTYEFNIANNEGASSSILKFKKHKKIWPDIFFKKTVLFSSVTLEELIIRENINIKDYQALVLDTQGSELLVLKGAKSVIKEFTYIATEAADFESYKDCCTLDDINKFLSTNNFIEMSRKKFVESITEGNYYDVVYKRKDLID